jgi:uncharacterized protein
VKKVFADTQYWVAKIHPQDQWHQQVIKVEYKLGLFEMITSESILIETLNYFGGFREDVKETAALVVRSIYESDEIKIIPQTTDEILQALSLYEKRLDKGYSLTDCISMEVCRTSNIKEIFTHDHHFTQEGFQILL